MTYNEAKHFLNVVNKSENEDAKHLMKIALFTGICRSELLTIESEDVNLEEGFYMAINNKSRDKHKEWKEILKQVKEDFRYFMEKFKSAYPFKVCTPTTLTHWTKKLLRKAELSEDLHHHSFALYCHNTCCTK